MILLLAVYTPNALRAQCGEWDNRFGLPSGMNGTVYALTTWDPDGEGPIPPQIVAGGDFTEIGGVSASRIARWDGTAWHPMGKGMTYTVFALTTWDPDGPGPLPPQLVAGGQFMIADDRVVNGIARWDGAAWQPLGAGMNGTVAALVSWSPGEDATAAPRLVAGGDFTFAGGVPALRVAQWDGTEWRTLGAGFNGGVYALTTWRQGSSGKAGACVIAGGGFTASGGVPVSCIARWDGSCWLALGQGVDAPVYALCASAALQPGEVSASLFAGGVFSTAGGIAANHVASWDGTRWQRLGSGSNIPVFALASLEVGLNAVSAPSILASGGLDHDNHPSPNLLSSWAGDEWQAVPSAMTGEHPMVFAITPWESEGTGPHSSHLVVAGGFDTVHGVPAGGIALWSRSVPPKITVQPRETRFRPGGTIALAAAAVNGRPSVRWYHDGLPIHNGPGGASAGGGTVWGALTSAPISGGLVTLTITNAQRSDAGNYTAVFTNSCGSTSSEVAVVEWTICNHADIAQSDATSGPDGVIDNGDFLLFMASYFAGCVEPDMVPCGPADIARSEATPGADGTIDNGDFLLFISTFFAGCE